MSKAGVQSIAQETPPARTKGPTGGVANGAAQSGVPRQYVRGRAAIHFGRAEAHYPAWPRQPASSPMAPTAWDGFPGDRRTPDALAEWYEPHVKAWSEHGTPGTTLWFWNTEVGWATVHPLLQAHGWEYRCCNIWDKGLGHIAGNANTRTLRKFPVVTEVCVHLRQGGALRGCRRKTHDAAWLRQEWRRTGLPLRCANDACGRVERGDAQVPDGRPPLVLPAAGDVRQAGAYANTKVPLQVVRTSAPTATRRSRRASGAVARQVQV